MLQSMRSAAKYVWILIVVAFVGGFLLAETSGLLGRGAVTTTSAVAEVNGEKILYTDYARALQNREQQESQQRGRALTLDERQALEKAVFDEMVNSTLLRQELERRRIGVTDDEIRQAAQNSPPPELLQNPELQTEGRFDPEKYRRFLANPAARAQGLLQYLESFYRTEIPRQKLFAQVAGDVFVSDARLWSMWQDTHDSAQVSFVALRPELVPDAQVQVSDADLQAYYDANRKTFERPGRAVLSLLSIPRTVTAADTAAARARAAALRAEILGGAKFEDVAKRESVDSASGAVGGSLGRGTAGRFVPEFEAVANTLPVGQLSEPVLTQFGFHVIRVDARQGDTLDVRHILLRVAQSDSSAARTDRRADSLANIAASVEDPKKFDEAAAKFGLRAQKVQAIEGEPLTWQGRYVPSVGAWAFSGARVGESSELFDAPDAYYLARVDSLAPGGVPTLAQVREEVKREVVQERKLAALLPKAQELARAAARSSLEQAAMGASAPLEQSPVFTRVSLVPGLGQFSQAIGAAFGLPAGTVSGPIQSRDAVVVLRVDRRVNADKGAWQAQKAAQRQQATQAAREARVRAYLDGLRQSAKIEDNRRELQDAARRQANG